MYARVKWYSKIQNRGVLVVLEAGKMQGVEVWFSTSDLAHGFQPNAGDAVCLPRFYRVNGTLFKVDATAGKLRATEARNIVIPHRWIVNISIVHGDLYRTVNNPKWYPITRPAFGFFSQTFETSTTINATIHDYEWRGDEMPQERED